MAYDGLWFDPLFEDLNAFVDKTNERCTGDVKVRLYKGALQVIGRRSPEFALYNEDLASFDSKTWDQAQAAGIVANHDMQAVMYNRFIKKN